LSVFVGGVGLVAYIAAWIVVPENPHEEEPAKKDKKSDSTMIWGLVLIAIGGVLLLQRSDWFGFYPFWDWGPWWSDRFDAGLVLPIILIVVGLVYLISVSKKETEAKVEKSGGATMEKKLTRSVGDKMIAGVCGGLAKYFNIDSSIVRILWVVAAVVATPVLGVLLYIVMIIVVPEETAVQSTSSSKSAATKSK
jgi:phage shock protein PspC (stress-responsive transcriptional regulator)